MSYKYMVHKIDKFKPLPEYFITKVMMITIPDGYLPVMVMLKSNNIEQHRDEKTGARLGTAQPVWHGYHDACMLATFKLKCQ